MSLLTSLIKASTQFQRALTQPPADNNARGAATDATPKRPEAEASDNRNDDRFTLSERAALAEAGKPKSAQLSLTEYRLSIGQDIAYVRETLRHKLAEYRLSPHTKLEVSKSENGTIAIGGPVPEETRQRIEGDLNNSRGFREAFSRLSASEPTLHFMDNALKLNKAYGVNNPLLDTIVSENQQFNGLQDIIHRYDALKRSVNVDVDAGDAQLRRYAFNLNARA